MFTADTILDIYHSATNGIFAVLVGVVALSLVVGGYLSSREAVRDPLVLYLDGANGEVLWRRQLDGDDDLYGRVFRVAVGNVAPAVVELFRKLLPRRPN
jgi:hypothetical protein